MKIRNKFIVGAASVALLAGLGATPASAEPVSSAPSISSSVQGKYPAYPYNKWECAFAIAAGWAWWAPRAYKAACGLPY